MKKSLKKILNTSLKINKPILAFNIQNLQQLGALALSSKKIKKSLNLLALIGKNLFRTIKIIKIEMLFSKQYLEI
jgi:hypothetical protein